MIRRKEVFFAYGSRFDSFDEAVARCEEEIGRFIDRMPRTLTHNDRIALHDYIIENRAYLRGILSYPDKLTGCDE